MDSDVAVYGKVKIFQKSYFTAFANSFFKKKNSDSGQNILQFPKI